MSSQSYRLDSPELLASEGVRLRTQAKALFQLELPALEMLGLRNPTRILDIGCGNGEYLSLLANTFPEADLVGVDRNPALIDLARLRLPNSKFYVQEVTAPGFAKFLDRIQPSAIIMRFFLQHLLPEEIESVLYELKKQHLKNRSLFVIEADDSKVSFAPPSPQLSQLIAETIKFQADRGGNRTLGSRLANYLDRLGFEDIKKIELDVGSQNIGWEMAEAIFLPIWKSARRNSARDDAIIEMSEQWFQDAKKLDSAILKFPLFLVSA